MTNFKLLQLPNLFPSMEAIRASAKRVISPILISHPSLKYSILILLDLATNQICSFYIIDSQPKVFDLVSLLSDALAAKILLPGETIFHCMKGNPFTGKGFTYFLLLNNIAISFYNRRDELDSISITKSFFKRYKTPSAVKDIPALISRWNENVSPNLNTFIVTHLGDKTKI